MGGKSLRKCEMCGIRRRCSDIFLARFPCDPTRCREWVRLTGNEDLAYLPIQKLNENRFICGDHFHRKSFNKQGNRLKRNAIPSLNLNTPLPDSILSSFPLSVPFLETSEKGVSTNQSQNQILIQTENVTHMQVDKETFSTERKRKRQEYDVEEPYCNKKKVNAPDSVPSSSKGSCEKSDQNKTPVLTPLEYGYSHIEITPRKKKLIKKLQTTRCLLTSLSKTSVNLQKIDSNFLKNIIVETLKNQDRKPTGKRWDLKNKISALQIFKRSPRTYRFLQHTVPLPSVRTIQRLLKQIDMSPGITTSTINQLRKKASSMLPADKICALLFDEISLKKRLIYNECSDKVEGYVDYGSGESRGRRDQMADKALVFMIQGIRRKYKQPLAYYFVQGTISSENLSSIIKEIINVLEDIGLTVITTVCDQGPTNCGALNLLKKFSHLLPTSNYFLVNERKVFTVFDIPHLFKSIRNNFYEAGTMKFDGKVAKWQHLRDAEALNTGMLYFHKISSMLLDPKQKLKMKVKYAAQTLSNTFAAILKMIAEKHHDTEYGKEVAQTSEILRDLNALFDVTNGPANFKDVIKGRRENVSKKSNHIQLWNIFLKKLDSMEFMKSDSRLRCKNVRCVQGYIISINSLKDIWSYCQGQGFKFLNLRSLNQDALENLFGMVRQSSPTNRNPTCTHFTSALKSIYLSGMNAPHSRGSNCEDDFNKLLFVSTLSCDEKSSEKVAEYACDDTEYPLITIPENDFEERVETNLTAIENQPIVYLSGYIAYRILKNHNCLVCNHLVKVNDVIDHPMYKYINLREWWDEKQSLTYPSIELCRTIEEAVTCFQKNIQLMHEENVGQMFCTLFLTNVNSTWWKCRDHQNDLLKQLFWLIAKILIRRQCQIFNEEVRLKEEDSANAQKITQLRSAAK